MTKYKFKPLLISEKIYKIPVENALIWHTATNIMHHRAGVLRKIGNIYLAECEIENTNIYHIKGTIFVNPDEYINKRVFVSEHIHIDGYMEWIITSEPIFKDNNFINFINVGHKNNYIRIDYYTGANKHIQE